MGRGISLLGLVTGVSGLVGMFPNMTSSVAPLATASNYLLPAWMVVLGVVLVRWRD
jgi:hypothetical protein